MEGIKMDKITAFIEACSKTGAVILLFSIMIIFGILTHQPEVWRLVLTALTTYVTAGGGVKTVIKKVNQKKEE
jgi:hypothetical protein